MQQYISVQNIAFIVNEFANIMRMRHSVDILGNPRFNIREFVFSIMQKIDNSPTVKSKQIDIDGLNKITLQLLIDEYVKKLHNKYDVYTNPNNIRDRQIDEMRQLQKTYKDVSIAELLEERKYGHSEQADKHGDQPNFTEKSETRVTPSESQQRIEEFIKNRNRDLTSIIPPPGDLIAASSPQQQQQPNISADFNILRERSVDDNNTDKLLKSADFDFSQFDKPDKEVINTILSASAPELTPSRELKLEAFNYTIFGKMDKYTVVLPKTLNNVIYIRIINCYIPANTYYFLKFANINRVDNNRFAHNKLGTDYDIILYPGKIYNEYLFFADSIKISELEINLYTPLLSAKSREPIAIKNHIIELMFEYYI
jgi:hypothetical protein